MQANEDFIGQILDRFFGLKYGINELSFYSSNSFHLYIQTLKKRNKYGFI